MSKKSRHKHARNLEEWEKIKSMNNRVRGRKNKVKGTDNIFNKIVKIKQILSLKKEVPITVQEALRTPSRLKQKRNSS